MKQLPIYRILKADAQVFGMLGERIYEDVAPEKTPLPYLVWTDLSGTPNTSLDNITNEDDVPVSHFCNRLSQLGIVDSALFHFIPSYSK